MSFRVRIRSRAGDDIRTARDWYEDQVPGLGERLGIELDTVIGRIAEQPLIYHPKSGGSFSVDGHRCASVDSSLRSE